MNIPWYCNTTLISTKRWLVQADKVLCESALQVILGARSLGWAARTVWKLYIFFPLNFSNGACCGGPGDVTSTSWWLVLVSSYLLSVRHTQRHRWARAHLLQAVHLHRMTRQQLSNISLQRVLLTTSTRLHITNIHMATIKYHMHYLIFMACTGGSCNLLDVISIYSLNPGKYID